jgi:hypothetical protein
VHQARAVQPGAPGDYGTSGGCDGPREYDQPEDFEGSGYEGEIDPYGYPGIYGGAARPYEPSGAYGGAEVDAGDDGGADANRQSGRSGQRGEAHAGRPGTQRPASHPSPPAPTGLDNGVPPSQPAPARREAWFLITVLAVIVAAGVIAAVLLLGHHGKPRHAAASPAQTPSATLPPASSSAPPPAGLAVPPPLTGAAGHLGVPRHIGVLHVNPQLTQRYVGPSVRQQDANSFFIPVRDVVSGFYTTSPSMTTFAATDPRLMFLVAYLDGSGNAKTALRGFMSSHTFYGQQRIDPGRLGGVAACGLLPQRPAPVAHCMWADSNTYADFYAWHSSTSELAKTMIANRARVELTHRR